MGQLYSAVSGIEFTLPAGPPLVDPPLSLLGESTKLLLTEGLVAKRQQLVDQRASAAQQLEAYDRGGVVGDDDQPGQADSIEDARKALEQQDFEWSVEIASLDDAIKELQRWEFGFLYLPELSNGESLSIWVPDSGTNKVTGPNQDPFYWYDPFIAVAHENRSLFGWPNTDFASRVARVQRSLRAHEGWQVEHEFWSGDSIPTNYHLSASPQSVTTSPHRTIAPWPNPTPTPGTVLGVAESLSDSLASLDQSIADLDAGTGMVHATPYVVQKWSQVYPFLRDSQGNIRTVNNNILVPGYGYPGTGPDGTNRNVTDGVTVNGSTAFTSATAAFTTLDLGRPISDGDVNIESARSITDGVIVAGATSIVSNQATFASTDVGKAVIGAGVAPGTTIASVTSARVAVLSQNAIGSLQQANLTIGISTTILAITSGTAVVLSQPALAGATGIHAAIGGTGGRATGCVQQWAYATEMVGHLGGDIMTYPRDLREISPDLPVKNNVPVRAERGHAMITNRLLRAAVVVDTSVI